MGIFSFQYFFIKLDNILINTLGMTSVSSVLATALGGAHINIKPCINRIEVCAFAFVRPRETDGLQMLRS